MARVQLPGTKAQRLGKVVRLDTSDLRGVQIGVLSTPILSPKRAQLRNLKS